jgi:hypothetical protein
MMAAQKRKAFPITEQKGQKASGVTVTKHVSHCPRSGYLEDKERREVLKKNLERMGCRMLFDLPWRYTDEKMIKKIVSRKSTTFLATIQAKPDERNAERLSLSWMLSAKGKGMPPKKENLAKDYFVSTHSNKDGWKSSQCNHQDLREVLEFLVPLINPKKPKWMTIQVASTVVECLINKTKISWAKVFEKSIQTQVDKLPIVPISYLAALCN